MVVANDATVKAGSWWPETIKKMLRAQEIAMRCRIPIIYLVDSVGREPAVSGRRLPRTVRRRRALLLQLASCAAICAIPQLAAVMGPCIAGGAYLPALSDVIVMVKGTSFMGLGGPNLVKGATGQTIDGETLGGAVDAHRDQRRRALRGATMTTPASRSCAIWSRMLPAPAASTPRASGSPPTTTRPNALYDLLPADHRMSYDMHAVLGASSTTARSTSSRRDLAREMICGDARIDGIRRRRDRQSARPRSRAAPARSRASAASSTPRAPRRWRTSSIAATAQRIPLLFVQDVSGFMVGPEAEHDGIIRAGARFVEAMATARVPKIVLTVNHASGAGYYAMAGQGFDPDFIFSWPTGRMAVMEGESAVQAVHGPAIDAAKQEEAAGARGR